MASVFRKNGSGPWLIEYFDQHGRRKRKSSGVTDRRKAEHREQDRSGGRAGEGGRSRGKAKREDVVPLHPELLAELKAAKPPGAAATDHVFPTEVTNLTRKLDFERAGIKPVDELGRVADLHGLRSTLGTRLARAGVAPQVAQRIMRHADYRTTLKHYTALSLADTAAAMRLLPGGHGESAGTGSRVQPDAPASGESAGTGRGFRTATQAVVSSPAEVASQQNRQRSAHDFGRDGATSCDDEAEASGDDPGPNSGRLRKLREPVRRPARLSSVRGIKRKLLPNPLGNRRSILLSLRARAGSSVADRRDRRSP